MSIKIVFEFDGEIMLNDVPVEYSPTRIVEDAFRQLRAEIADLTKDRDETRSAFLSVLDERNRADAYSRKLGADIAERDAVISACAQTVGATISPECSPEFRAMLPAEIKSAIAERDARIGRLENALKITTAIAERSDTELAQLRAQEPVAWMWSDMIGIPHTHISPTRPTWPDAGASSAMSVAINVRPLYAEPMPAKSHPDICPCQTQPTHYAGEMPCPLSQAAKVAE